MIWTIIIVAVVASVLFALGWGIGYRVGYRDGDGAWRRASGSGYARVDSSGRLVNMTKAEHDAMDKALRDFKSGKPAKVERGER